MFLTIAAAMLAAQGSVQERPAPPATQPAAPAVTETAIAGFPRAKLYSLLGPQRRPVLVILPGAEGGDGAGKRFGPVLARLGYAAVSFPYYSPNWGPTMPPPQFPDLAGSFVDIRIDQLARLRDALAKMPGVDAERFGLFGGSKGAEFALIAASRYPWIDAVAAFAPSDLVWEGWGIETIEAEGTRSSFSVDGKPLPFMPYRRFTEGLLNPAKADLRAIHENGRADHPERETAARIPVERYRGRLILIAGDQDRLWNSGRMARNMVAARTKAGLKTDALIYPEAGHDLGGGSATPREDPRGGGTPAANAAARADAWPKVMALLKDSLKP